MNDLRALVEHLDSINEAGQRPTHFQPTHFHLSNLSSIFGKNAAHNKLMYYQDGLFYWMKDGQITRWNGNVNNRGKINPASVDGIIKNGQLQKYPDDVTFDAAQKDPKFKANPVKADLSKRKIEQTGFWEPGKGFRNYNFSNYIGKQPFVQELTSSKKYSRIYLAKKGSLADIKRTYGEDVVIYQAGTEANPKPIAKPVVKTTTRSVEPVVKPDEKPGEKTRSVKPEVTKIPPEGPGVRQKTRELKEKIYQLLEEARGLMDIILAAESNMHSYISKALLSEAALTQKEAARLKEIVQELKNIKEEIEEYKDSPDIAPGTLNSIALIDKFINKVPEAYGGLNPKRVPDPVADPVVKTTTRSVTPGEKTGEKPREKPDDEPEVKPDGKTRSVVTPGDEPEVKPDEKPAFMTQDLPEWELKDPNSDQADLLKQFKNRWDSFDDDTKLKIVEDLREAWKDLLK